MIDTIEKKARIKESIKLAKEQDERRKASMTKWAHIHPQAHRPIFRGELSSGGFIEEMWVDESFREITRSVERERTTIKNYLNSEFQRNPSFSFQFLNYEQYLSDLTHSEGVLPMKPECRLSINIPAYMEENNVYSALSQYVRQVDSHGKELDSDLWEINIIVNRPSGAIPDGTVKEIKQFIEIENAKRKKRGQKEFNINYIDVELDEKFEGVGTSRKILTDLTFYRSLQRSNQENPLYINAEDMDCNVVDSHLVHNAINKLDRMPHLDAIRALQDRVPEILMQNDYLFIRRRLEDFATSFLGSKVNSSPDTNPNYNFRFSGVGISGANATFTAEAVALVGGYQAGVNVGEGRIVGERITMARGDMDTPNKGVIGKVGTRMDTSPRRILAEIMTDQPTYSPEMRSIIREADDQTMLEQISHLKRINNSNKDKFETLIAEFIARKAAIAADPIEFTHHVMFWLGFKRNASDVTGAKLPDDYSIDAEGFVHITNWMNIENRLHDYRTRHTRARKPGERWKHHMMSEATFATFPSRYTLDELRASENTEMLGDYVFCLDKEIGRGWHGKVFAGYNRKTGATVAIKTGSKEYLTSKVASNIKLPFVENGESYVRSTIALPHASLLLSTDQFVEGDTVIRMSPAVSITLDRQIKQAGKIEPLNAITILERLIEGVKNLHDNGIGHFDLAPVNILFDDKGLAYITDFDEVVRLPADPNVVINTNGRLLPPEALRQQATDNIAVGPSTDTYELGVCLYYMLTGRYPFDPQNNLAEKKRMYAELKRQGISARRLAYIRYLQKQGPIIPEYVPEELKAIVRKSLQVDPTNRYQTADEMLKDIRDAKLHLLSQEVIFED